MNQKNEMSWSFYQLANLAATDRRTWKTEPRNYIWATELDKAPIDIYHAMLGTQPTNLPNDRSLRKFHAGDIWEFYAYLVLYFAGILRSNQDRLTYQYPGLLMVSGRQDFIAGGVPDWKKARETVRLFPMTDPIQRYFERLLDTFESNLGNTELREIVIECKSVGSFMFPKYEATGKPSRGHEKQIFHYLISQQMDEGHITYISKDDSLMLEFGVWLSDRELEREYRQSIQVITDYYNSKTEPPKADLILFDEDTGKFTKNWRVEYSPYLTKFYGFETPRHYSDMVTPDVSLFNRSLSRKVMVDLGQTTPTGKKVKLTKGNIEGLDKMKALYPDYQKYIHIATEIAKTNREDPN